jgi:hypothetical protein
MGFYTFWNDVYGETFQTRSADAAQDVWSRVITGGVVDARSKTQAQCKDNDAMTPHSFG